MDTRQETKFDERLHYQTPLMNICEEIRYASTKRPSVLLFVDGKGQSVNLESSNA